MDGKESNKVQERWATKGARCFWKLLELTQRKTRRRLIYTCRHLPHRVLTNVRTPDTDGKAPEIFTKSTGIHIAYTDQ